MTESPKDIPNPNLESTKLQGTASTPRDNSAPLLPGEEPARHLAPVQDITERKRIEETLQQNEEKHRRLIEMTDTGYVIIDDLGRVLDANREYVRLTGRRRPEEIIGHSVLEWTAPHDHERNAAEVRKCVEQGFVRNLEIDYVAPAGPVIRVEINATVLRASGILQILCLCRDITERKRAEAAESEARRLLRDILNTVPVRVFWKDRESRYLGCNLPFAKDAGLDSPDDVIGKNDLELARREQAEAWLGKNDLELAWREQADAYRADDRSIMETGVPKIGYEESQTTFRGDRIWLRTSKIPLKDATGKIFGVLGTYEDITEARRSEEALRQSEERLRLAQDAAKAGTWEWDLKTNKNVWSDELWPLYGLEPHRGEATYETWRQSIVPEDRERTEQAAQNAVRNGTELNAEWRVRDRDGKERWLMSRGKPIRDIQGQVVRYLGIVIDITDRKRVEAEREKLQAQLVQAQKMESVGRLAGGVAHDFNNMLQAILGNLSLALEQVPANGQLYEDLLEIQKAAQRSADLTRQLLAFARKQTVSPKILDLNDTVSGMLKMLQRLIGEDVHLAWLPGPELWPVRMDPAQLDQVLANLTVNARDAIAGVGKITIETANTILDDTSAQSDDDFRPGDYVLLVVSDTGCGMAPETKAHLFEPFFTTKGVGEGTGLGLATVYGVVKQNGGHISVVSEPGQGATFKLYLPRAEAQAVATAAATEKKSLHGTGTVLLVEDEEQILNLGRRILQQHGYAILAARLPELALKLAEQYPGPIHLLVTDVIMPGMNGRELRDRVAALKPGLRCVFMSGYTAEVIAHQGVLEDDIQFLQKPFTVEALARRVREVLDQPIK